MVSYATKERYATLLTNVLLYMAFCAALFYAGKEAYGIRLYAIKTYGRVIHEVCCWPTPPGHFRLVPPVWHPTLLLTLAMPRPPAVRPVVQHACHKVPRRQRMGQVFHLV